MKKLKKKHKKVWFVALLILFSSLIWMVSNIEKEHEEVVLYPEEGEIEGLFEESPNLGEIEPQESTYFIEYRMKRDRIRSQEIEMLKDLIDNPDTSQESKRDAEQELLSLVVHMEKELKVENLIKAKGYKDVVFFFEDGMANVVVKTEELSESQFLQIAEEVAKITEENMENIKVITKN